MEEAPKPPDVIQGADKDTDKMDETSMVTSPNETKDQDSISVPQSSEHKPSTTAVTKSETDAVEKGKRTEIAETSVLTSSEAQIEKKPSINVSKISDKKFSEKCSGFWVRTLCYCSFYEMSCLSEAEYMQTKITHDVETKVLKGL